MSAEKRSVPWIGNTPERKVQKVLGGCPIALEELRKKAIEEEAAKKKKKEEDELEKKKEQALQIGLAFLDFKLKDLVKQDTCKNMIRCRGEDFVSSVHEALSTLKEKLGKHAKGTVFSNVLTLGSTMLGISTSTFLERSKRLIYPAEARAGRRMRLTRKQLRKRAAAKLSSDDKKQLLAYLQECWKKEESVTLDSMLAWARESIDFQYGKSTLSYVLGGMGLCFRMKNHNPVIEERKDLVILRERFMELMEQLRAQDSFFAYFDETWVYEGMVSKYAWQFLHSSMYKKARLLNPEAPVPGPKKGAARGRRGIVAGVITRNGVLKGTEQVWVSSGKLEDQSEDYHREMNHELYEEYMKSKVIPALIKAAADLNKPAVLVIDNAPYHNRYVDKAPTKSNKKAVIADWLTSHGVNVSIKMKKVELVAKLEEFIELKGGRSVFKRYVIDEYAKAHGIRVVRLPPYHCFLNPIELLWSQLKQSVMKTGTTTTPLSEVRLKTLQFLRTFPAESANKLFDHVEKIEQEVRDEIKKRDEEISLLCTPSPATPSTSSSEDLIQLDDDSGDFSADFEMFLANNENADDMALDDEEEAAAQLELRDALDEARQEEGEQGLPVNSVIYDWYSDFNDHFWDDI